MAHAGNIYRNLKIHLCSLFVAGLLWAAFQGFYAEIKYDGERLQLHKRGAQFDFFSRNLKAVQPHKTQFLKDFIPRAFPKGQQLIIDGEVLLVDNKSGQPLPFGTLGKHKKEAFKDASVCLFVFDLLHLNDDNLMARYTRLCFPLCCKHDFENLGP